MCNKKLVEVFLLLVVTTTQVHRSYQQQFRLTRNPERYTSGTSLESAEVNEAPERDNVLQIIDKDIGVVTNPTRTTSSNITNLGPIFTNPNLLQRLIMKPSGNMMKLKCQAKGDPEPTIEWTKDGQKIERKMGQVLYNKWKITLEDLIPSDSGLYTCKVCNIHKCINFTTIVEVHVRYPSAPIITEGYPKNLTVLENSTAEFTCPIMSDLEVHIEWAKYSSWNTTKFMIPAAVSKLEVDDENAELLSLKNVTFSDEGWYSCVASNSLGSTSASAYLHVVGHEITASRSANDCVEEPLIEPINQAKPGKKKWLFDVECAAVNNFNDQDVDGSVAKRGRFPFLAALIHIREKFFCGGSLITDKHVLTAAHCVHQKYSTKLDREEIFIQLGKHDLSIENEASSVSRKVKKILIHEDWQPDMPRYDGDLAILLMNASVEFSDIIRPICLTCNEKVLALPDGTLVGWRKGDNDHNHGDMPRQASMQSVTDGECFQNQYELGPLFSIRTFCSKGADGVQCSGDPGGSFSVKFDGHWVSKGIVSAGTCNMTTYSLYTKLSDFIEWINETVLANP